MDAFSDREQQHLIDGPAGRIELLTQLGNPEGLLSQDARLVVIAHPHPQHGGTMSNKVVATLARAYHQLGVATVRFNFRGVGASEGVYDHGRGEVDDVLCVAGWAALHLPRAQMLLAGFSFGSAMVAAASWSLKPAHLALVAPPVERYDYDRERRFPCPTDMVIGASDELVDVPGFERWAGALQGQVRWRTMPETGHFFHGQLHALREWLQRALIDCADAAQNNL